jgi:hypothetical protein
MAEPGSVRRDRYTMPGTPPGYVWRGLAGFPHNHVQQREGKMARLCDEQRNHLAST